MSSRDALLRQRLRKILLSKFPLSTDFDAFCLDHFPEIAKRFTGGMDYVARLNLLLQAAPPEQIIKLVDHDQDARQQLCPYFIPPPKSEFNYVREDCVDSLHQHLGSLDTLQALRVVSLIGGAGTGKTMVARAYADRHRKSYAGIFMLDAETALSLGQSCVKLGQSLQSEVHASASLADARRKCQTWLTAHAHWLLILKNAEHSEWLAAFFLPLVEQGAIGHVILISRSNGVRIRGVPYETVPVGTLDVEEGVKFLCAYAGRPTLDAAEQQAAQALVKRLGGMPLALSHAAHYLKNTGMSIALHLHSLTQRPVETLDRKYSWELARAVEVYLVRYENEQPLCAEFLKLCAFLQGTEIPLHLFYEGFAIKTEVIKLLGRRFTSALLSPDDLFEKLIKPLVSDGIIAYDPAAAVFSLTWLLQMIVRSRMPRSEQLRWSARAIAVVKRRALELEPELLTDHIVTDPLLRQTENCLSLIDAFKVQSIDAVVLLNRAGLFVHEQRQFDRAAEFYSRALTILDLLRRNSTTPEVNAEHACCLHGLGRVALRKGQYPEAEARFTQAMELRLRLFGAAHPDCAATQNNLALLRLYRGDLSPSVLAQFEQALTIRRDKLGPQHLLVAKSLNNIGMYHVLTRNQAHAEAAHREALALRQKFLNPNHPDIVQSLNGLALSLEVAGKDAQAEELFAKALSIQQKSHRPSDPDIAFALMGLARLWSKRDPAQLVKARESLEQALRLRQQALGERHPFTASSLFVLGHVLRLEGRRTEALHCMRQARRIWERVPVLPTHPRYKQCGQEIAELEAEAPPR